MNRDLLLEDLRQELARGRVIVLVGAGVSVGATGGAPVASWTGLLEDGVARREQLPMGPLPAGWGDRVRGQIQSGDVEELLLAAEAVTGRLGGREHGEYRRWLRETVGQLNASNREVLAALRDLGGILATTNYDGLLEEVTGLPAVTWQDQARAQTVLRGDEPAVLHLHGFWQEPKSVVLGVRSYQQLLGDEHAQTMQETMAAAGTLLFVGFGAGLADPNFAALRAWMSRLFKGGEYRHFRLARDDEVAALQAEHGQDERVMVLSYGPDHADLAPFLRGLSPASPATAPGTTSSPPDTRPRKPGGLPPVWNLLLASNPNFTGRTTILDALHAGLTQDQGMVRPQVIAGTGGVGKTQLAVEYAYRHRADYDTVWWISAETTASLHADYAALAPEVGQGTSPDQDAMVDAVHEWLERNSRWLLIFDNVDDPPATVPLLPRAGEGQLIMTSQQEDDLDGRADLVPLDVLTEEEATQFLLTRTKATDLGAARQLAAALGYLPLALEQAGAFIAETKVITLSRYLELFEQRSLELLEKGRPRGRHQRTVDTTWDLSLQRLHQETFAAVELLNLLAFLAPDDFPWQLLADHAENLPNTLAAAARDELALAEVIGAAQRYSLVKVTGNGLVVHRLLQAVIRQDLSADVQREWAAAAIRLLEASFPQDSGDVRTWEDCQRLLPHALATTDHAERLDVEPDATSGLLDRTATYLRGRAQYTQARILYQRALAIAEANLEPTNPTLGARLSNLGGVLQDLGDLNGAKTQLERALEIDEAAYGPNHPEVATDRNNLGSVLQALGDLNGAKTQYEQALALTEAALGPNHPNVAIRRNNLGNVLQALGDLNGAKTQYEQALALTEAALGPNHPNVAIRRGNLGSVLQALGDLNGAKTQYERALEIDEAAYGPNHPDVGRDRGNLGSVLQDLGDLNGAKTQLERALAITEKNRGPNDPRVGVELFNLAQILKDLGDLPGARTALERTVVIDEAAYGVDHPEVATDLAALGSVLRDLGDLHAATAAFKRAARIGEAAYGPDHPDVELYRSNAQAIARELEANS
jgi:tetratricopeptide (TPR) repeat protein